MIKASIVADSKNTFGQRLTTIVVTFPRYILAELNTHRMFSRNSASSRAIPFQKMIDMVQKNPFIPMAWQADHKGMQGTEYITKPEFIEIRNAQWLRARDRACSSAWEMNSEWGTQDHEDKCPPVTKQMVNRLLEAFMWHTVIITASEFENFFALRCPQYWYEPENKLFRSKRDYAVYYNECFGNSYPVLTDLQWLGINKGQADIHMMALAEAMWDAYNESTPQQLQPGEWHIPFGNDIDSDLLIDLVKARGIQEDFHNYDSGMRNLKWQVRDEFVIKIATARCARVSYTVVGEEDKPANYENDIKLHDRLAASGHWSPFEHCAKAMTDEEFIGYSRAESEPYGFRGPFKGRNFDGWSGNFRGFIQYRKTFANENITVK